MIQKTMGAQSLAFTEAPCIISSASVVGKKESEGPLGDLFDVAGEDDLFGEKTWEEAALPRVPGSLCENMRCRQAEW